MLVNRSLSVIAVVAIGGGLGWLAAGDAGAGRVQEEAQAKANENRSDIPTPDPSFKGVANRTLAGSKPDFPQPVKAPRGAPNVLLVLIDDAGYGNPSTFGGPCQTPTLTRLAGR